jgi:S1-C subfamily serine protease
VTDVSQSSRLWIGVTVAPADDTLRSQLRLPAKRGLVVTKVESDAPAAKAGLLVSDVLVEFGGKP